MSWRPITTAPMGTMVLCADLQAREAMHWAFVGWRHGGSAEGCVTTPERVNRPATHWAHLPQPPKSK
jgi:hypothetical protein